jgi:hypothetical protein
LRVIFPNTRKAYIYPATHYASTNTNPNLPAMGQRFRLKSGYPVPAGWTKQEKAVCQALKKYGGLVADNGGFFSISAAPDDRFPAGCFDNLQTYLSITNFEVVSTTGSNEGPRSPGKPAVDAGADMTVPMRTNANVACAVTVTGGQFTVQWSLYSGPGTATFGDSTKTNTTVSFSMPGMYKLIVAISDGVHARAYDTVDVNVMSTLKLDIVPSGTNVSLDWHGADPPFVLQTATSLFQQTWSTVQSNDTTNAIFPPAENTAFFRVKGR